LRETSEKDDFYQKYIPRGESEQEITETLTLLRSVSSHLCTSLSFVEEAMSVCNFLVPLLLFCSITC